MKHLYRAAGHVSVLFCFLCLQPLLAVNAQFKVFPDQARQQPLHGRLFVLLARTNEPEPRLQLDRAGPAAPVALAQDVSQLATNAPALLPTTAFQHPPGSFNSLPPGPYFAQALLDCSRDLKSTRAPRNWFSPVQKVSLNGRTPQIIELHLTEQIPPESPVDTELVKFVRIRSDLLSRFHGHDVFLRAGLILPAGYLQEHDRRYPLWIRIGGLGTRYTAVNRLMSPESEFRKTWLQRDTPEFILLQLDGAGPYGDPYYVNSENNGPYGDALVRELIPHLERNFRVKAQPRARVLSGVSTGGWVALALQIFYPDFFNGAWAACPDPVDFRALELIDIYSDTNAFQNTCGYERPSARDINGDTLLTVRDEVDTENLLGSANSYTASGQQWGAWNAAFSPRAPNGKPASLFDPLTGTIDRTVANHWREYDLRLVLERNWEKVGAGISGKLHISAGEADQYFLNNAVHLLDSSLAARDPPSSARIVYGPRKGHGWSNLSLKEMLQEMKAATD